MSNIITSVHQSPYYNLSVQYRATSRASHKSSREHELGQFLQTRRCSIVCVAPQSHLTSCSLIIPNFATRFVFTGATPVLRRLRDFQLFQSSLEPAEGFFFKGKTSGGSIGTVLRKPLRDFNRLTGSGAL